MEEWQLMVGPGEAEKQGQWKSLQAVPDSPVCIRTQYSEPHFHFTAHTSDGAGGAGAASCSALRTWQLPSNLGLYELLSLSDLLTLSSQINATF